MNEILISGYYGFKNSGDDALLLSIIRDLKKENKDISITVLSVNPEETERIYGVRSINRLNPFSIISAMKRAKMLISGGGTLIQDGTSTKSLLYYLFVISAAKLFGLKVMLYSNGIGPLARKSNVRLTQRVLNKVDLITLRDKASYDELERIGVNRPEIHLTADPAFTLTPSPKAVGSDLLRVSGADMSKKMLCVSVRGWQGTGDRFVKDIADAVDYAADKYGFFPVLLPMQPKKDYELSLRICHKMRSDAIVLDKECPTEDILSVMSNMDLCIGMRLHTLIYAASCAVPMIAISYDPKVSGFMEYMGVKSGADISDCGADRLKGIIDEVMADYDEIKSGLEKRRGELREKAAENAVYAAELLRKPE